MSSFLEAPLLHPRLYPLHLLTERLVLRTLPEAAGEHVAAYYRNNKDFFKPWSPRWKDEIFTAEGQSAQLARDRKEVEEGRLLRLWLFEPTDGQEVGPIGDFAFSNIVRGAFQSCFLGYKLAERAQGRGLMAEALAEGLRFAFDPLGLHLHRVEANIMPRNVRSVRLVERLGFVCEGLSPRYLQIDGVWEDHAHYARLNEEYAGG